MHTSWRRGLAIAGLLTVGVFGTQVAMAGPGGGACGAGGGPLEHLERQVARAGLPPETAQAIYQRLDQARAQRRSLEVSLDAAHDQMRELLEQDGATVEALMAQADTVGALETQMHKLGLQTLFEIRGLVTPAQWQSLQPKHHQGAPGGAEAPRS
jgi:Spy/CpxP family protein refolding chaperone